MQRKIYLLGLLYSLFLFPVVVNAAEPVQLIAETAHSISFTVDVPEPVFVPADDDEGVVCSVEGFGLYNEQQMPGVVLRAIMAAIPPGTGVEIQVSVHSSQDFQNIDLAPVPTFAPDSDTIDTDARIHYIKDSDVYHSDAYFPAQNADVAYTGNLRGMHFAQIVITPVQYNPVQRSVRVARSMTVTLSFDGLDEAAAVRHKVSDIPAVPAGKAFDAIRNALIINPDSDFMDMQLNRAHSMAKAALSGELQSSPFAIKIVTSKPGIYRVQYDDISMLGVDLSGLTNSNIKIENLGQEIAVYRSGTGQFEAGDYILFYAEDFQSEYSSTNVYWLYQGSGSGLTMNTHGSAPVSGFPQPGSFTTTVNFEQNLLWRRNLPDFIDAEDEWFWQKLDVFNVDDFDIEFTLEDFDNDSGPFEIEVYLRGLTPFEHHTRFILNGTEVGDFEWTGTAIERRILSGIEPTLFNAGANTLKVVVLTAPGNDPAMPDQYYLNWAALTYVRHYIADNNRLAFGADTFGADTFGDATFEVGGFSDPAIKIFDVSQPKEALLLTGTEISTDNGTSQVRFEYSMDFASALFAATPDSSLIPNAFIVDTSSDLMGARTDIDYIIITHAQFTSTVEDLRTIREQSGLRVEIVDVQDIYDEFSYGIKDVTAIKDFLQHAYFNWHATDYPTYVVLVGDATYDYRDNLGLAASGKADLVPTYLGYRSSFGSGVGATASDNWYACVDGDDPLPDMVIGRLSVKNDQDLQNIIDKIETYENTVPDDWQSRVVFAADKDDQNQFENMAEALINMLPVAYTNLSLYLSQYGSAITTATVDLIDAISNGALMTHYIGHGSIDKWSNSSWFETPNQNRGTTRDDVSLLTNAGQYTFLMILNCFSGMFSELTDDYCMAEEFMRQQDRGAVMCAAPSASGYPSEHEILGKKIYEYLFNDNVTIGGTLLTASKIAAYQQTLSRDLLETFIFFGDPALELQVAVSELECETDFDCDEGFECIYGVCSDTTNVECAVDDDCNNGAGCISNECVSVQIDKCKVKAGKNGKGDRIKLKGLLYATEADFKAAIGGNVIVSIEAVDMPASNETTFTFPIEEGTIKKGKYKSSKVKPIDKTDLVTSFKVNTITGKMKFSAKNIDLTGLSCPITVTIQIGDYVSEIVLDEDIVNGPKKQCPPELMAGL